jgi:head-tail adaptor
MTDHENQQEERQQEERTSDKLAKAVEGLFDVGKLWAAHGLRVGRSTLETSAQTLRATAGLLGELSDRFAAESEKPRDAA